MEDTRKRAAAYILRETTDQLTLTALQKPTVNDREDREALREVLNFFDRIGTVVQSGAIDEHFVWNEFFPTVPNYWLRAEPIVNEWRAEVGRLLYFEDAKHLSETLISYEEKQLARIKSQNEARPSNEKVRHFLQEESKEEN